MNTGLKQKVSVHHIPFPGIILSGKWGGTVVAICSSWCESKDLHEENVVNEINKMICEFNSSHHHSTSLRVAKKELVVAYPSTQTYMTLVQFYVKDTY